MGDLPCPVIFAIENGIDWRHDDYATGAAVAFGLMGMAEAIRAMPGVSDWTCRSCDTFNAAGSLTCDDCGAEWA